MDLVSGCVGGADSFVGLATAMNESVTLSLCGVCKLVDGQVTSQICGLATKLDLRCLLGTTSSVQRHITCWWHGMWYFQHCKVGGVTTWPIQGCCLIPGATLPTLHPLTYSVPRDTSMVLCTMAPFQKYQLAPTVPVLHPLGRKKYSLQTLLSRARIASG